MRQGLPFPFSIALVVVLWLGSAAAFAQQSAPQKKPMATTPAGAAEEGAAKTKEKKAVGADLVIRDLFTGTQTTIAEVSVFDFNVNQAAFVSDRDDFKSAVPRYKHAGARRQQRPVPAARLLGRQRRRLLPREAGGRHAAKDSRQGTFRRHGVAARE